MITPIDSLCICGVCTRFAAEARQRGYLLLALRGNVSSLIRLPFFCVLCKEGVKAILTR